MTGTTLRQSPYALFYILIVISGIPSLCIAQCFQRLTLRKNTISIICTYVYSSSIYSGVLLVIQLLTPLQVTGVLCW